MKPEENLGSVDVDDVDAPQIQPLAWCNAIHNNASSWALAAGLILLSLPILPQGGPLAWLIIVTAVAAARSPGSGRVGALYLPAACGAGGA